tara:strand:+ start:509 stop:823 length:315 start_codon:yes stop_codon:yes gene_type:complete
MMDEMGIPADPQAIEPEVEEGGAGSLIQQAIDIHRSIMEGGDVSPEAHEQLTSLLEQALSAVSGEDPEEDTMRDRVAKEVFGDPDPAPVAGMLNRKSSMSGGYQ